MNRWDASYHVGALRRLPSDRLGSTEAKACRVSRHCRCFLARAHFALAPPSPAKCREGYTREEGAVATSDDARALGAI